MRGSGHVITIDETRDGFSAVEIGHAFVAEISRGDTYGVSITVDDNVADHVRVSRSNDTLRIRLEDDHYYRDVTLEATITLPAIDRLALSGATSATVSGFHSDDDFKAELSGASSAFGSMTTGDLTCELSGASKLTLEGDGGAAEIHASGASSADLGRFHATDVDVDLSGASSAEVNASGEISATLSGASRLEYRGAATLADVSVNGGSTLRRRD